MSPWLSSLPPHEAQSPLTRPPLKNASDELFHGVKDLPKAVFQGNPLIATKVSDTITRAGTPSGQMKAYGAGQGRAFGSRGVFLTDPTIPALPKQPCQNVYWQTPQFPQEKMLKKAQMATEKFKRKFLWCHEWQKQATNKAVILKEWVWDRKLHPNYLYDFIFEESTKGVQIVDCW